MKHLPIDPNVVWQKQDRWDVNYNQSEKQIIVPNFKGIDKGNQENSLIQQVNIPQSYIHENIVYPDENDYSCDEEDIANSADPIALQQLDLRKNLNNSRNYCKQLEMVNNIEYSSEYYDKKVERLKRPLLRVFMRASENDYRMNQTFRPSRTYKQKRQKRLNLNPSDFEMTRNLIHLENQVALSLFSHIKQREQLKLKQLQAQKTISTLNDYQFTLLPLPQDTLNQLKELKQPPKEIDDLQSKDNRTRIFESCNDQECSYQFNQVQLQQSLIEFMDEQYLNIKDRSIHFPKHPTILNNWNIDNYTKMGCHYNQQSIIYSTLNRTMVITDRTKKNKKKLKLMLIDRNRASVFDGVRANYEHFSAHCQRNISKQEYHLECIRKDIAKQRQEQQRKEMLLKQQQKKEEQRALLKFKINVSTFKEPDVKKTVKIKQSEGTHFVLIQDGLTKITLKQENSQIVLK